MLTPLLECGATGKLLHILESMFSKAKSCAKWNGNLSEAFGNLCGVLWGGGGGGGGGVSWMDDSHHFSIMSTAPSISEIRLFQSLTSNLQGQCYGCGQKVANWFTSFSHHINQTNNSRGTAISKFHLEKSMVRSKVTWFTHYPTDILPSRFMSIEPTIPGV